MIQFLILNGGIYNYSKIIKQIIFQLIMILHKNNQQQLIQKVKFYKIYHFWKNYNIMIQILL